MITNRRIGDLCGATGRIVALCDCDNFFVSCERRFHPSLEKCPVVVLSSNDGCIISRSNEVKAMGIPMGTPYFKVKPLLERKGVAVLSGDIGKYVFVSREVMHTLSAFSDTVEAYSIDEAFLNLSLAPAKDPFDYASKIRQAVRERVGIPMSVGIAGTRTLSKIAASLAKKRTSGVFLISEDRDRLPILEATPVEDVWGIGRKSAEILKRFGVKTAADLTRKDPEWIRRKTSIRGVMIARELQGFPCHSMISRNGPPQSIQDSRTFGHKLHSLEALEKPVLEHALRVGTRLRKAHMATGSLTVYVRSGDEYGKYRHLSRETTFDPPVCSDHALIQGALLALREIFVPGCVYTKAGVCLKCLSDATYRQTRLFDDERDTRERKKLETLSRTLDTLNRRMGKKTIYPAALVDKDRTWQPRKDHSFETGTQKT